MFNLLTLLILFVVGCLGGVLAGLLGVGGGIVYVGVLAYYLKSYDLESAEAVKYIVSNSIFGVFFAGLAGTIRQVREKNFFLRETLLTAIPGIFSSLLITWLILSGDWYTKERFTIFFVIMLALLSYRMFQPKKDSAGELISRDDLPKKTYSFTGALSGAISSLSGLGGGVIIIPVLSGLFKLKMIKASSISLAIMPFYTLVATLFYMLYAGGPVKELPYSFGYIVFPLAIPISMGVILCAPLGVRLSHILPARILKFIFGIIMIIVIVRMLYGLIN